MIECGATLAIFDEGAVSIERIPLPPRAPGEIDVSVTTAAICGSDVHTVLGHRTTPARTALGHEGVGVVKDVDEGARDHRGMPVRVGDRVVFSMLSTCNDCDRCRAGLTMKCRSLLKYGHESVDTAPHATGTLADSVRLLPTVAVLRVPEELTDEVVVSAGCAVATAASIVGAGGDVGPGTRVLVLGAGAVGVYTAAMFVSLGCVVDIHDPVAERMAIAALVGASPAEAEATARYPVVVEASGSPEAFSRGLSLTDIGGHLVAAGSVSLGSTSVTFDPAVVVRNRLTVAGVHNYTAENFVWGIEWLQRHGSALALDRLASPSYRLSAVSDAFEAMRAGTYARVLVRPGPPPSTGTTDRQSDSGLKTERSHMSMDLPR